MASKWTKTVLKQRKKDSQRKNGFQKPIKRLPKGKKASKRKKGFKNEKNLSKQNKGF